MADWNTIQNDPDFQSLSDADKATVKAKFEASQKANVNTTAPKQEAPASKPTIDFSKIESDPDYQALSDEDKQVVQKQYQDKGGVINSGSGSTLKDIGNTINAGLASMGNSIANADRGIGDLATEGLTKLGVNPDTAKMIGDKLAGTPETQTEYKVAMDNARNTKAGRLATEYGSMAGDIAVMAAAPEVAPILLATKETGSAYNDQAPGEKSVGKALVSGTVNYAANKALPLAGGKIISSTLGRVIGEGVQDAATEIFNKAIGQKATTAIANVGKNAVAGVIGGAPAGAASAYARGGDVVQGGKEGAEMGAIFGAGSSAVHTAGTALKNVSPFKAPVNDIAPEVNKNITKESDAINAAKTHQERDTAFEQAKHANTITGLKTAQEHGLDVHTQAVKGNEAGQAIIGANAKATGAKMRDARSVAEQATAANKSFKQDINTTKINNDALFTRIKSESAEATADLPTNSKEAKTNSASLKNIQDNLNTSQRLAAKGDYTNARKYAIEAQNHFDNAPDHIQEAIKNGYQAPKGFTEGFDPVAHIHEMQATQGVIDNTLTAAKEAKGKGLNLHLPFAAHLGLAHATHGLSAAADLAGSAFNAMSRAKQNARVRMNEVNLEKATTPTVEAKNTPEAPDVDWNQFSAKHSTKWMQSKVDDIKSSFNDPKLADKINVNNVANETYVKGLLQQDRAANRDLQSQHIETVATRKNTRQQAQQEAAQTKVDDYFSNEGSYHDKAVKAQAIEQATKGGKLLNADRVIEAAQNITSKTAKPGTREEFYNYIDSKTTNVPDGLKKAMKGEISKLFNGKERLSHDEQKTAWKQIGDWEAKHHEFNSSTEFANAAREKASKSVSNVEARQRAEVKARQVDETARAMESELKDSGMNEKDISDFINNHTESTYSKAKSDTAHKAAMDKAREVAKQYAESYKELNVAQREEKVSGVSDDELKDIATKLANNKPLEDGEADHVQSTVFKSISEKVKAKEGGKTSVKPEQIESQIDLARDKAKHFLAHNPPRLEATLRALDVMEKGLKNRAANPGAEKGSWITSKDLNGIEGATAWGLQRQAVEAVTGENYDTFRKEIHGSETAERKGSLNTKAKGNAVKAYRIRKAKK
ncbi:TPA: hypothetical protein SCS57_002046 [Enterobacter cloacae]|nr:hypothetical protein [Enterobacter cloacae]